MRAAVALGRGPGMGGIPRPRTGRLWGCRVRSRTGFDGRNRIRSNKDLYRGRRADNACRRHTPFSPVPIPPRRRAADGIGRSDAEDDLV
jgi:hypothetical protein